MHIGLILKTSKYCNLRCSYCCEMDGLADRKRMPVDGIKHLFTSLRSTFDRLSLQPESLTFYWHGGEPLALPIPYWNSIFATQSECLGERIMPRVTNALQSNLTLVRPSHLPLLQKLRLGFSHDGDNRYRTGTKGRSTHALVERNIAWLAEQEVPLAGIAVVSKANVNKAEVVANFYLNRNLSFRFIHLDEALEHRPEIFDYRVDLKSFVSFGKSLWRLPRVRKALANGLRIDPLSEVLSLRAQAAKTTGDARSYDELAQAEHLLEVDVDGEVRSTADYPYRMSYGNAFKDSFEKLLLSPYRQMRIERSVQRLKEVCAGCDFFRRGCNGWRVSHATEAVYGEYRSAGGCEVRLLADVMS